MDTSSVSTLQSFAEWVGKHPQWSDLKAWLLTQEPTLEIIEFENSPYVILKMDKGSQTESKKDSVHEESNTMSEVAQLCRSVVWDTRLNLPCCVAPFAARRDQKIPNEKPLRLEDFVEGVMINLFRYRGDPTTHVTTRSRLDADGTFYSDKSFRALFDEALAAKNATLADLETMMCDPNGQAGVKSTFISLVLAHPEHRVVRAVDQANLWTIYRGSVMDDGRVNFTTNNLPAAWCPKSYSTNLVVKSWTDLKDKFEEIKQSKPWYWQGLVVHTGLQRWRFRNADHDRVRRDLRGTESNSYGRFLRLRANKRIQEYLRVYPEDSDEFQTFESDYRGATKTLYAWYCRCHKEHSIAFKAMPKSVQPLVFGLHKLYLEKLKPTSKTLRLTDVIDWIIEHLKSEYGVPNLIRMTAESIKPPPAAVHSPIDVPVSDAVDSATD
uniref:Uncharacterized protein n=1 Tax=viral metagenome TaxID=1070528 RepID=A0A6C0K720_9ZZZZ